ncbi:E3 ubiquitin-protein ligase DCST1-like [Octopus sinensis]|nr:E3 ubiquitin-protein ligase DCST1-like [Octopus sinensis]
MGQSVTKLKYSIIKVLKSDPSEYRWLKAIVGFPIGLFISLAFYVVILSQSSLPVLIQQYLGAIFCILYSFGYAFSAQVRCMAWLVVPNLFGRGGRSFIHTIAVMYLVQGPINSIVLNGKIVVSSFRCASELIRNHSVSRFEFSRKPLETALFELKKSDSKLTKLSNKMKQSFSKIEDEIESQTEVRSLKEETEAIDKNQRNEPRVDMIENKRKIEADDTDADTIEKRYAKKSDYRCQSIFNSGINNCKQAIDNIYNKCIDKVKVIGPIVCQIVAFNFVCNVFKLVPNLIGYTCDSMPVLGTGFGEVYVQEKAMLDSFGSNDQLNFQYKVIDPERRVNITTLKELQKSIMHTFKKRQVWINFFQDMLMNILGFTFLLILVHSYSYTKNYLVDLNFDNIYITAYFRRIDIRRAMAGKMTLLPLRKFEENTLVTPLSCRILKGERKKIISGTLMLIVRYVVILNIVMFDWIIYTVLNIIKNQSRIDYHQKGFQKIEVAILGSGFMSDIVRTMLNSFTQKHTIDEITTNFLCLPKPVKTDKRIIYQTLAFYIAVWFLMLSESFALRLRRLIAAFFFRRREKSRILYLYNSTLKKRRGYINYMKEYVSSLAKQKRLAEKHGLINALIRTFPRLDSCLKRLPGMKPVCLICADKLKNGAGQLCSNMNCMSRYCSVCWCDMEYRCYACP